MGEIEVIKPGLFSSIQDLGRFGFREFGVPYSGSMDLYSHKLSNLILGNDEHDAVLEITQIGPDLWFKQPTLICICGANLSATLNSEAIKLNSIISIQENDRLSFGKPVFGYRAYLAIFGGFQTEKVLNSLSWYEGISSNRQLLKGMSLPFKNIPRKSVRKNSTVKVDSSYFNSEDIEVFPGPEFEYLNEIQEQQLETETFTVGKNANRMAIQLQEIFSNDLKSILTGPVIPGTVQLTAGGRLIVLMRDCQTTGGYPRILQLSERSINKIAQKSSGQCFSFKLIQ